MAQFVEKYKDPIIEKCMSGFMEIIKDGLVVKDKDTVNAPRFPSFQTYDDLLTYHKTNATINQIIKEKFKIDSMKQLLESKIYQENAIQIDLCLDVINKRIISVMGQINKAETQGGQKGGAFRKNMKYFCLIMNLGLLIYSATCLYYLQPNQNVSIISFGVDMSRDSAMYTYSLLVSVSAFLFFYSARLVLLERRINQNAVYVDDTDIERGEPTYTTAEIIPMANAIIVPPTSDTAGSNKYIPPVIANHYQINQTIDVLMMAITYPVIEVSEPDIGASESDVRAMNSEYRGLSLQLDNIRSELMRMFSELHTWNTAPVESFQISVFVNNYITMLTSQIAELEREMNDISTRMSQIEQMNQDVRGELGGKRRKSRSRKNKRRRATRRRRTKTKSKS
jgi:hypothetical protein